MASLFVQRTDNDCRLLDAGAGIGSLSAAFLQRWADGGFDFKHVQLDAFEIDESLLPHLAQTLEAYSNSQKVDSTIRSSDFVISAADWISGNFFAEPLPSYTHAILNPPYKKIRSDSEHRSALRRAGIETVNLYSAFVALSLALLEDSGQLVAIIPRSFCNGPYYRPFREYVLQRAAIRHLHLFESRDRAFKDDDVLQENIIILLERSGKKSPVTVTSSTDASFANLSTHEYPFDQIISPDDPERFIHVPTSPAANVIGQSSAIRSSLTDLGIRISTGPVVDFRLKEYLRDLPEPGTVPLLYPGHFNNGNVQWPNADQKKPNAIQHNSDTKKWLYPNGFYCVVRRFSSKEEKRRIVASVVDPATFSGAPALGFENHLNVFHDNKRGLTESLARGLTAYLNSTAVDEHFRRFSGHTQVNATDLKQMRYPHLEILVAFGDWALTHPNPNQAMIDDKLETLIS